MRGPSSWPWIPACAEMSGVCFNTGGPKVRCTMDEVRQPHIEVEHLQIHYGDVLAVRGVSFTVNPGEQLTLLGPSGCGKTTTLRAIAGLEQPSAGEIRIGGAPVYSSAERINIPAEKRGL